MEPETAESTPLPTPTSSSKQSCHVEKLSAPTRQSDVSKHPAFTKQHQVSRPEGIEVVNRKKVRRGRRRKKHNIVNSSDNEKFLFLDI